MQSKYSLDGKDTRTRNGVVLYRIVRPDGSRGGYIQTEANLSQEGTCWVHGDSEVFGEARINQNAQVYGQVFGSAAVSGDCKITGQVFDSAKVTDRAEIMGRAYGRAVVRGAARVMGEAFDDAVVEDQAMILGRIGGHARAGGQEIVIGERIAAAPGGAPSDSANAPVTLMGFTAPSVIAGSLRIYLDPSFACFVDISEPEKSIVGWTEVERTSGLVRLSVKPTAKVNVGRKIRSASAASLQRQVSG